jgi:hypothetical protein
MLQHEVKAETIVFDVRVTHPDFSKLAHHKPFGALEANWRTKRKLYESNYVLKSEQIQPIVFDTYGGWHKNTTAVLFKLTKLAATRGAKPDKELVSELWKGLRFRIAKVLVERQYRAVAHLNWRLRGLQSKASQASVVSSQAETEDEEGMSGDEEVADESEDEIEEVANYSGSTGTGVDSTAPAMRHGSASPGEDRAE